MSADDRAGRSLVAASVHLAHGLHAAECVNPDGTTGWWLMVEGHGGCTCTAGCNCRGCAPHEQGGRLPAEVRKRLGAQCRWINPRTGRRCSTSVDRIGDDCSRHTGTVVACPYVMPTGRPCGAWTNHPSGYCAPRGHRPRSTLPLPRRPR